MADVAKIAYYLMIIYTLTLYYVAKGIMGFRESTYITGILYAIFWPIGIPLALYEMARHRAIDTHERKRYNTPWK